MDSSQDELFELISIAYRQGVLGKILTAFNEGLEAAMDEGHLTMWEVMNMLDETKEETMMMINRFLEKAGAYLTYLKNEKIWWVASEILSIPVINDVIINQTKQMILKNMATDVKEEMLT